MGGKVNENDYLFLTARVRALERTLLTRERMERMLEAPSAEEAARVLTECGYPELNPLTPAALDSALRAQRARLFDDLSAGVPDPALIDVFRLRYDYHNVKVLLKAEATGADGTRLLADTGRVPAKVLAEAVRAGDLRALPGALRAAAEQAREVLGSTGDPQQADFVLDRAWYAELTELAREVGSEFLTRYVETCIDAANLRTAVRTRRMGRGAEFLQGVLLPGGSVDARQILSAVTAGRPLADCFAASPLREAALAGGEAASGGRLTRFEKLCDDAVTACLREAALIPFGEAPVVAYLAARESEATAVRIILGGRLAGLPTETIRERLRESYV